MTRDEELDLRARVGAAGLLAMALEAAARIASTSVGDLELAQVVGAAHGQAIRVMVHLRRELRRGRSQGNAA